MGKYLGAILCTLVVCRAADECRPLTDREGNDLTQDVREKYKLSQDMTLKLSADSPFQNSCYRDVQFEGRGPIGSFTIKLYVSPDRRFLAPELFDATLKPAEEERKIAQKTMSELVRGSFATLGPATAPNTVVIFSDFQCPFCKNVSSLVREAISTERSDQVLVIFRHLPLASHDWSRPAALAAACAQFQSSTAFWKLHDLLFEGQSTTTKANVAERILGYVSSVPQLNELEWRKCFDEEMSLGAVLKDIGLARSLEVNATPTLFINGERLTGLRSADELRQKLRFRRQSKVAQTDAPERVQLW
jgi:protein-disulfide isomerase